MVELRHLRVLETIKREGSFSAAARALGYSQPAITQQIRALERSLGTPLVIRARSGMRMTEAGEVLLRHGQSVLATMSLASAEIEAIVGLRAGRVRIVCFPSAAATILPIALAGMTAAHPDVTFTLAEAETPQALDLLERGECDVAVVYHYATDAPAEHRGKSWRPLLTEAVHVVLPTGHPAAEHDRIDLRDLRNDRWIVGCPRCRGHVLQLCEAAGFAPDIAFETDDYIALQALTASGLGVAVVPDLILSIVTGTELRLRPLTPPSVRSVSAVTTAGMMSVPSVRETVAYLGRAARQVAMSHAGRSDPLEITAADGTTTTAASSHPPTR